MPVPSIAGSLGASKGCVTCRRRKVKCDETKPQCLRCQKARRRCEGYERELHFVDMGARSRARSEKQKTKTALARAESDLAAAMVSIPRAPSWSAMVADLRLQFLSNTLFNSKITSENFPHRYTWISTGLALDPTNVSHVAVQSLASAYFARMHGNPADILVQCASTYGKAMVQLATKLTTPHAAFDNGLFVAVMALHTYELIIGTDKSGWIHHAKAMAQLVEMRGPEGFQQYPEHGYFLYCRSRIINVGLHSRKRTFLERPEWQTVPWNKHPETRTSVQDVLDIMSRIPGHFEDVDLLEKKRVAGGNIGPVYRELQARIVDDLRLFIRWRWKWEHNNPFAAFTCYEEGWSALLEDMPRPPRFTTVYSWRDLTLASDITFYNMGMMALMSTSVYIRCFTLVPEAVEGITDEAPPLPTSPLLIPHSQMLISDVAREVCRCADFYLTGNNLGIESIMVVSALMMSLIVFCRVPKSDPWEREWASGVLKRIGAQYGLDYSVQSAAIRPKIDLAEQLALRAHPSGGWRH